MCYIVAVIARRTGILLHAIMVMSNHYHIVLTDPEGRVCEFTRDCHAFIARALNAEYGDFESLWSSQQTSHVTCIEPDDVIDKIAYSMANPVKAGLVEHGDQWPGIRHCWPTQAMVVHRTGKFFANANEETWPETVVLEFARPPGHDELCDDGFAAMIGEAVEVREEQSRQEVYGEGRGFLGAAKVLRQSRYQTPTTREEHFKISPRVACRNKWLRIERLARDRVWLDAYNKARRRWSAGDHTVEFPHGTYKMRVVHAARCADPPS